jgi:M6 family metalloprotease-like protein
MEKLIRILFLCFIFIGACHSLIGVIAYPYPVEIIQPDGSKITIILRGDEHIKWAETVDGYTILRNTKDIYEYATLNPNNDLVPSGILARNPTDRSSSDNLSLNNIRKGLFYSKSQVGLIKSISKINVDVPEKVFPTTGSRKLVCILIGFTDLPFTKTKTDLENLFNQVGYITDGATGSVYDFYKENSFNQLDLTVTVAGPYTASNTFAYYGANDEFGDDLRPRELVTEAVILADPYVNYADFDNDGDGTVDGVYVIYAGFGEEYSGVSSDAIWAHAWSITPLTLDGKTISRYSCSSELRGNSGTGLTRIGVICHEFGHVMGAADFYDTDYSTGGQYSGTGNWDIMAGGSWNNAGATPAHHNVYTKVYYYKWATETTLTATTNITLNNAEQNSNSFYRINTATANEFFLIENRQQHKFDTNIPGHGMIIYHVDGNYISIAGNKINAGSHQGMYPVCANATGNPPTVYGTINSGGLPFPGTGSRTYFTDGTTPWSKSWAGANTYLPVTNISENILDKTINFDFPGFDTTNPNNFSAGPGGDTQVNLSWSKNSSNNNVMIAYSTTSAPGTPVNGTVYSVANSIPGGGIVVYSGNATSYNQSGLTAGTKYYYEAWSIKTGNSYSTGVTTEGMTSYTLPFSEYFSTSALPYPWTTQNTGNGISERWSIGYSAIAGSAVNELKCTYQSVNPGTTRVITPAISTIGVSALTLSFKHFLDDYAIGSKLLIQSSSDRVTWTNELWSIATGSGNIGPATINTSIANNLNSATTYLAFVIDGNLFNFDYWYIDDILITKGVVVPALTTTSITSISHSTAVSGGYITADGGGSVIARGTCWATSANPTIVYSKTLNGTGTGSYVSNLTGLLPDITYHVRAYATNSAGTGYGNDVTFTTNPAAPFVGTIIQPTCTESTGGVTLSGLPSSGTWTLTRTPGAVTTTGSGITITITGLSAGTYIYNVTNSSGSISSASTDIVINTQQIIPAQPGSITGSTAVCQGVAQTYSIASVTGATTYTWTLPQGWTGSSATTSVSATPGAAGGAISVTANNACGSGTAGNLNVTVNISSTAPIAASANPASICSGSSSTLTVSGGSLGTGASWQWYSGSCGGLFMGTGNSISVSPEFTTSYYVRAEGGTCNITTACSIVTLTVHICLEIEKIEEFKGISIYPNPASDHLIMENDKSSYPIDFEIVNSDGKIIYNSILLNKSIVDLKRFSSGIYYIRFKEKGSFYTLEFIKE